MDITFIRHAQPTWVLDGKSVLDPQLTELGWRQARRLAERARGWPAPTRVLVSSTIRAQQTAEPVCDVLGMRPEVLPWLQEMKFPEDLDGVEADEVIELIRDPSRRTVARWWEGIPGGERYETFHARVTKNLDTLLETFDLRPHPELPIYEGPDHDDVRLWIFGHGGTNAVAAGHLLDVAPVPWAWERFATAHTGVTRLRSRPMLGGQLFGLVTHSDVRHLSPGERTR